jgi:hypothetical protein
MAFGSALLRDYILFVQPEASYGVSPGALAGTDAFKHTGSLPLSRKVERYFRSKDRDSGQASVLNVQPGRETGGVAIECDLIPSGVTGTPTPPDIDELVKANMGTKLVGTAHTTTTVGSAGTDIVLVGGGIAASGIAVGQMIACDQDGAGNYEVRQVVTVGVGGADHFAVDRAFTTTNVATGRAVKVGVTYRLLNSALLSVYLWQFNSNNLRYVMPGCVMSEMDLSLNYADGAPVGKVKFNGMGQRKRPQTSTTIPTPSVAGVPLVPTVGKIWLGAVRYNVVNVGLNVKNGLTLRNNQSDQLFPSGVKRTDQDGRYEVTQTLEMIATDVTQSNLYDTAPTLTQQDAIVQLNNAIGNIVAWRTPNFRPDVDESEIDGEVGHKLSGRCLGVSGDDEVTLAFI